MARGVRSDSSVADELDTFSAPICAHGSERSCSRVFWEKCAIAMATDSTFVFRAVKISARAEILHR